MAQIVKIRIDLGAGEPIIVGNATTGKVSSGATTGKVS